MGSVFWDLAPGEEDAWLLYALGYPLKEAGALVYACVCLKTTLQWCLVGLLELGDTPTFLAWLILVDSSLIVLVLPLQIALCGLFLAGSYC